MSAVLAEPNTWVKWEMVPENAVVRERLSPDLVGVLGDGKQMVVLVRGRKYGATAWSPAWPKDTGWAIQPWGLWSGAGSGEVLLVATGFDEHPTADEVRAIVEAYDRSVLSYMSLSA